MSISRRQFTAATASLLMLGSVGCASMSGKPDSKQRSLLDRMPWTSSKDKEPEPYPNPAKIAATWTPDTLVQIGRTPTRGFGGRIFFYNEKSLPVPVAGTLTVHGFNESAPESKESVKRFEFTPEQFTRHFSQTDIGASYSVWIPWDAIGGDQQRISLVTSFKTVEGKLVQGVPATVVLPGRTKDIKSSEDIANMSDQYRNYQDALAGNGPSSSGLTTTTISRRQNRRQQPSTPGINLPGARDGDRSMLAGAGQTPSLEISVTRRPYQPTVQPVSAQEAIKR